MKPISDSAEYEMLMETNTTASQVHVEDSLTDIAQIQRSVEAILFAAGHPVTYAKLADVLELTPAAVRKIVEEYATVYNRDDGDLPRGIMLLTFDDCCQLCTREQYGTHIREALGIRRGGNLSASSIEVLAIVAYNEPVTRAYIDQVRGVDSSYTVGVLAERGLIEACGKLDVPGRPTIYKTGEVFLRTMGISDLEQLPALPDLGSDEGIIELQNKIDSLQSGELDGQMSFDQQ